MKRRTINKKILFFVTFLFSVWTALPSYALEVRFLQVPYSNTQEKIARAIVQVGRADWERGRVEEELGRLIHDQDPHAALDQGLLGKAILQGAVHARRRGEAEERLGSAILAGARVFSAEKRIVGEIQERMGGLILAIAQNDRFDPEVLLAAARMQEGRIQEALGKQAARTARLRWAEGELSRSAQSAFFAPSLEVVPLSFIEEALSTLRKEQGYLYEEDLRLALTLIDRERGQMLLPRIFPPQERTVSPAGMGYTGMGKGGFWEFGFFALAGFLGVILAYTWVLIDLEDRADALHDGRKRILLPHAA